VADALADVRVLDLSESVAGQFAARLFADNGADVVLAEPPGGSALRRRGPFAEVGGERWSCLFWHLNLGKRAVAGGPTDDVVRALAADADVVLVDPADTITPLLPAEGGPRVVCDVTGFGRSGVLAGWSGGELVHQALAGTMFENGRPDREPLYGVGHRASYAAGAIAYLQCVAVLLAGGPRRRVDVSVAEVAASMSFCRATQYAYNGTIEGRDARTTPRAIVRCADGWVAVFIYDHRWRQSCAALGLDDLVDDPRFATEHDRLRNWDAFVAALEHDLRDRPVDQVLEAGQREKVVVAKAITPLELADDPQLRFRGWWDRCRDGELPRLGPMFGFSDTPQRDRGPAPGAPAPQQPWISARRRAAGPGGDGLPLAGITVLDLTTAWSGPMATRILAALGADVLKVEGPGRIDDWRGPVRGGLPSRYPDLEPGERPYDRCFQFNTQNHDKRGITLDLKTEAGRTLAVHLALQADVLIANFSAGTLDRMGLGSERLRELNPRLIVVEMPAYGDGGPMGAWVALGPSMELMCGMGARIGYGDGRPTTTGPAYLDPIGGFNSAAAVLTALAAREATGVGQRVELAQREAAMYWIGEQIVHAIATGRDTEPDGNHVDDAAPHDAFPARGDDEWVAIAASSDAEFGALCEVLGLDGWAGTGLAERKRREQALNADIARRTRDRDKHELAAELQAAGVPAAPVANARDVASSAFLAERGLLQRVKHPAVGSRTQQGLPLHVEGWDLAIRTPAPCFGQDTEQVLRERVGLHDGALAGLRAAGVISDRPRGADPAPAEVGT